MAREYFNAYHSYLKSIELLNDAERGRLFTALLIYSSTGTEPELRGNERFIFPTMKEQIDRDEKRYADKCKKQSENANMRWHANACQRMPTDANDAKAKEKAKTKAKTKAKEKESIKADEPPRATRFTPPSLDEVKAYCQERGNNVDPERFIDFYSSKGWMIGKNKMKDWKAAVRNWESRDKPKKTEPLDYGEPLDFYK